VGDANPTKLSVRRRRVHEIRPSPPCAARPPIDASGLRIRGDEENSFVTLESLEKKVGLQIRVTVVGVLHISALA